jgi:hypothetical protein
MHYNKIFYFLRNHKKIMNFENRGEGAPKSPEQKKYKLCWRNKTTGATGHGEYMNKKEAESNVNRENSKYSHIEHWLESEDGTRQEIQEIKERINNGDAKKEHKIVWHKLEDSTNENVMKMLKKQ